jgi:Ohr subfamily peroxiredoxin
MAELAYTAVVHVVGGRQGVGRTADGAFEVTLKGPVEMGGPGGGANPEQLFALGYAACFESAVRGAARRQQLDPTGAEIEAKVLLFRGEDGSDLAVEMAIHLPNITDPTVAADLIRTAHGRCPYSRATRNNVPVSFTVNGTPVDVSGVGATH